MREACERNPRERRAVDACVVFMFWPKGPVTFSDFINRLRCALHELREALSVIEIDKREGFIWEHERSSAVDDLMDQHLALSQAIAEWFDLVRRTKREVMIGQPNTRPFLYSL